MVSPMALSSMPLHSIVYMSFYGLTKVHLASEEFSCKNKLVHQPFFKNMSFCKNSPHSSCVNILVNNHQLIVVKQTLNILRFKVGVFVLFGCMQPKHSHLF